MFYTQNLTLFPHSHWLTTALWVRYYQHLTDEENSWRSEGLFKVNIQGLKVRDLNPEMPLRKGYVLYHYDTIAQSNSMFIEWMNQLIEQNKQALKDIKYLA